MKFNYKSLILSCGVASTTAVIIVILTVLSLEAPSSREETAFQVLPIIIFYGLGYSAIVCILFTPLIVLLSRAIRKVNRLRWLPVLVAGPVFGLLAALPPYFFQRAGVLFHMADNRFSLEQISVWFLLLGAMAGFAGSITFAISNPPRQEHEASPE